MVCVFFLEARIRAVSIISLILLSFVILHPVSATPEHSILEHSGLRCSSDRDAVLLNAPSLSLGSDVLHSLDGIGIDAPLPVDWLSEFSSRLFYLLNLDPNSHRNSESHQESANTSVMKRPYGNMIGDVDRQNGNVTDIKADYVPQPLQQVSGAVELPKRSNIISENADQVNSQSNAITMAIKHLAPILQNTVVGPEYIDEVSDPRLGFVIGRGDLNQLKLNHLSLNNLNSQSRKVFDARIAVVDIEAIFEHSIAIKDIRHKINKIASKVQKEMYQKELELKKFEEDIIKLRGLIPEDELNQKLGEFHHRVTLSQQTVQKHKVALDRAHNEAISAVHQNSVEIIIALAAKYQFNLVLPTTQVIYAASDLNITMEVIEALNKRLTHIDINYDSGK